LVDCSWTKDVSVESWPEWASFRPNAVDIILWSLLAQALRWVNPDIPLALEQCGRDHREAMETLKKGQRLKPSQHGQMLRSALSWRSSGAVIILDKVHFLEPFDMGELKSLIQNTLRLQESGEGAQTRAILVGHSLEMSSTFEELPRIRKETEYQGTVLVLPFRCAHTDGP